MDEAGIESQSLLPQIASAPPEREIVSSSAIPPPPSHSAAAMSSDNYAVSSLFASGGTENTNKKRKGQRTAEVAVAASKSFPDSASKMKKEHSPTTTASKIKQPYSVTAGKSVSDALKENFAKTMASAFADHIIAMTDEKYLETK